MDNKFIQSLDDNDIIQEKVNKENIWNDIKKNVI